MTPDPPDFDVRGARRRARVIAILAASERAGLAPLPLPHLHTIAYFADALSPVWDVRIVDAQLLKRPSGPFLPPLQSEVDGLVGRGIVVPHRVTHVRDGGTWRLDAQYTLNNDLVQPILRVAESFAVQATQLAFVREVVYAVSALGFTGIEEAPTSDASYGSDMIDEGGVVDIASEADDQNATSRVALRFATLMAPNFSLADSELIHLYVRELHRRMTRAAA